MSEQSISREQLAAFDGREGRKAYVAVSGKVYDVSASPRWQGGDHEGAHTAGADLTEELKAAPHVRAVVERFPVVGQLVELPVAPEGGGSGGKLVIAAVVVALLAVLGFILTR